MNTKTVLSTLFLISVLLVGDAIILSVVSETQQERAPGVKVDNWAIYGDIKVTWTSNDPQAEPDPSLILFNNTDWFKFIVTKIEDTIVWFQNITQMKDGTQTTNELWIDVNQGYGNAPTTFISAGLQEGDSLYADMTYPLYINETHFRTYIGVSRETNHLNLTFTDRTNTNPPQIMKYSFSFYWDKATGIITERQASLTNQTGEYSTSWSKSDVITGTDLWSTDTTQLSDDNRLFWVLGIAVITLLAVTVLYHQRKTKSRRRKRLTRRRIAQSKNYRGCMRRRCVRYNVLKYFSGLSLIGIDSRLPQTTSEISY